MDLKEQLAEEINEQIVFFTLNESDLSPNLLSNYIANWICENLEAYVDEKVVENIHIKKLSACLKTMFWKGDENHPEKIEMLNAFNKLIDSIKTLPKIRLKIDKCCGAKWCSCPKCTIPIKTEN